MQHFDCIIAGAGIVGLTTAYEILHRAPSARVAVVEKEATTGRHASGRNSGVLHCGLYYGSDTRKAQVCAVGGRAMKDFADAHGIPWQKTGKVLVATDPDQLPAVERLMQNAADNAIRAERIDNRTLLELEPAAPSDAVAAIHCPDTSVIDAKAVLETLRRLLAERGARFYFQRRVLGPAADGSLQTTSGPIRGGFLFNCCGAYADVLAKACGLARLYLADHDNFRLLARTETRKYSKRFFHQCAKRLFPGLALDDLVPTAKAGIRPQLVNVATKRLEMDYILEGDGKSLHVLNAISPAFTGSFAFARMIVDRSGAL